MGHLADRIYAHSPVWAQQLAINVYGWYRARRRLGPVFERTWRAYVDRESWAADRMNEFVEGQLRQQVQRAYREVPHYRKAFRDHGLTEEQLERFSSRDLLKLPLLDRQTLRTNAEALLTEQAAKSPPEVFSTSGTTGTPARIYWDTETHQHNIAVREARSLRWAGVSYRDPRATIGLRRIVPKAHSQPPFWRYNRWESQVYLSAFHISPTNVPDYVQALNRFRPVYLEGFATACYFLASCIAERGLTPHRPRAIITGSEALRPEMRTVVESVFHSRAYEEYGAVENCTLATECERGSLHVHQDFGYLELIRPDGKPAGPGEIGEVVGTGFANRNQIFIRYRLGDLAMWDQNPCLCGRSTLPTLRAVVGRLEDTVVLADGRRMAYLDFLFKQLPGIVEGQVIQEELDRFVVNVLPSGSYSQADEEEIRQRAAQRLGPEIKLEIRKLSTIPREPNGKLRLVISRVADKPATGFVSYDGGEKT
jgi:phenylacetate-CoA ligase